MLESPIQSDVSLGYGVLQFGIRGGAAPCPLTRIASCSHTPLVGTGTLVAWTRMGVIIGVFVEPREPTMADVAPFMSPPLQTHPVEGAPQNLDSSYEL